MARVATSLMTNHNLERSFEYEIEKSVFTSKHLAVNCRFYFEVGEALKVVKQVRLKCSL